MPFKKDYSYQLPSKEELATFIKAQSGHVSTRDLVKAFNIKGHSQRIAFKKLIKTLQNNPPPERKKRPTTHKPSIGVAQEVFIGQIARTNQGICFIPIDKKIKTLFSIENARSIPKEYLGYIFKAKIQPQHSKTVKILSKLGSVKDVSTISASLLNIPMDFPEEVLREVENVTVPPLAKREDVRTLPLVTIDGKDSRDFDDAIWAEPDKDPSNPNGWHLIVSIADVAHYVRPGSALDKEALKRGTSVYFPDKVIPMLPEALSNDVCSLKPNVARACVGVHLWIDQGGHKIRHQFFRGLMQSAARLTYEEVQKVLDNPLSDHPQKSIIRNLFKAYHALSKARIERGTLDIEVDEPYIVFDGAGNIKDMVPRPHLSSHKLIEEFMVLANVAAAETLKKNKLPCLYRVHDTPDQERIQTLKTALKHMGVKIKGPLNTPYDFTKLLQSVKGTAHAAIVNDLVLRCQQQAVYSPVNIGHFGLNLREYCHFTSPIRRYPDILIHRGILSGLGLVDGLPSGAADMFQELGEICSSLERRAISAERDAMDRYMTHFLAPHIGDYFTVYISGITKAGLFINVEKIGASGLIPIRALGNDYFLFKEQPTRLEGRRTRKTYGFGDILKAKLIEADLARGRLLFGL